MIGLLVIIAIGAGLGGLVWYGLRGRPNDPAVMGHNFPYPRSVWGATPMSADDVQDESELDPHPPVL